MKKNNLAKMTSIAFLSSFVITMYATKIKSVIFGVDIPSYFIFTSIFLICSLLILSKEEINDCIKMITKKDNYITEIPDKIYNFCKNYYFESEETTINYLKSDVKNKGLANFLVRYIDKNTKDEIDEYLSAQKILNSRMRDNARKVITYINFFIPLSILSSYIYSSNIKGILLISGILCVANLFMYRNIEKNVYSNKQEYTLYKNIAEDILNFKNAKYIMYKCKNILAIEEDFITIDNLDTVETSTKNNTIENEINIPKEYKSKDENLNIEDRKSALITIGKKTNKANSPNKREIRL